MDVKNRELHRINKENGILSKFQQNGRTEDKLLKRHIMKASKKIQKAFRGVVDEEEMNADIEREVQQSEIHINQIHGEGPLPRKTLFTLTGKNKLIEAAFKEKDFDPYFCLGFVLSVARNIFVSEISKAAEVYYEACDNQNSVLVVRRIFKNIKENHLVR